MKAVILAGGMGTRLSEETDRIPKPLADIGGRPILWHIMKHLSHYGINDFVVCAGYKGDMVKDYFANYRIRLSSVTFGLRDGTAFIHSDAAVEPWRVTVLDTGLDSTTGHRLAQAVEHMGGEEPFLMTYGDGVGDIDVAALLAFARSCGALACVTAVRQPSRFGVLELNGHRVSAFAEKPSGIGAWISGGYFVLSPRAVGGTKPAEMWEQGPLQRLAERGELAAYRHEGFWHPMDTMHDKSHLNKLWSEGRAPWKVWT